MTLVADLSGQLDDLGRIHRRRALKPRAGLDFASNDYLGLASAAPLLQAVRDAIDRGIPIGSGGSRLLRGNHEEHEALEAETAEWIGAEAALFFSSGYAANSALLSTLPQRGDLIVYDELIHASVHEGLRLARAQAAPARHNLPEAFDAAIASWRASGGRGRPWIAVESLYSMDGDRAPLAELAAVASRHEAILIVDEAHATGVFGSDGRGLASALSSRADLITVHTCGKALGCEGALICGPTVVRDFLVNRGRAFIFSTAPSPLMAAAVRAAIRIVRSEPERRSHLLELAAHSERRLGPLGAARSGSQILPLILGDDARTMAVAGQIQERGFDVRGIRPPTVPAGTARLRVAITLNVDAAAVDRLATALEEALA